MITNLKKDIYIIIEDIDLMEQLISINPSLVTRDSVSGKIKFRHGALGKYLSRLIREDVEKRKKKRKEDALVNFIEGGGLDGQ